MAAFAPLLDLLAEVPDFRRGQGQVYKLPYVLLFSILAIVTGCNSCRGVVTFIDVHRQRLNATFGLKWRRAPAHTALRYILKGLDPVAVEAVFRRHAALLQAARATPGQGSIALDGKTLRGSFDNFHDRAAAQVLSAFATDTPSAALPTAAPLEPLAATPWCWRTSTSQKRPMKSRRRKPCWPNSASPAEPS